MTGLSQERRSVHLDRVGIEAQHLSLKEGHKQATEVEADAAQAHAAVHAVLQHARQAAALPDARQHPCQCLKVEHPASAARTFFPPRILT